MLASIPSQHLESDCPPCRNPKRDSTSTNHALVPGLVQRLRYLRHNFAKLCVKPSSAAGWRRASMVARPGGDAGDVRAGGSSAQVCTEFSEVITEDSTILIYDNDTAPRLARSGSP